jgi:hypothetical protein
MSNFDFLSEYYVYNEVMENGSDHLDGGSAFPAQHKNDNNNNDNNSALCVIIAVGFVLMFFSWLI